MNRPYGHNDNKEKVCLRVCFLFLYFQRKWSSIMNEMKELISKLREADHAYYDLDEPIMSDREYNQLYEKLEQMEKETGIIMSDSPTQKVQGKVL